MGRRKASGTCEIEDEGGTECDVVVVVVVVVAVGSAFAEGVFVPLSSSSWFGDGFAVYSVRAKVDRLGV